MKRLLFSLTVLMLSASVCWGGTVKGSVKDWSSFGNGVVCAVNHDANLLYQPVHQLAWGSDPQHTSKASANMILNWFDNSYHGTCHDISSDGTFTLVLDADVKDDAFFAVVLSDGTYDKKATKAWSMSYHVHNENYTLEVQ